MTNKREELIKEAAKAIADVHNVGAFEMYPAGWVKEAEAALAVFEQSPNGYQSYGTPHTPTKDERTPEFEALEEELFGHQPVLSMSDGSIAGCQCFDRVFHKGTEDWGTHLAEVFTALHRPVQGEPTDANQVSDEVADAAQIAMHEFCFGDEEPIGRLSVARQGWKVAIAAALRAAFTTEQGGENRG